MTKQNLNRDAQQQIESLEEVIKVIRERGPYSALTLVGVADAETPRTFCTTQRLGVSPLHGANISSLAVRLRAEARRLEEILLRD